MIDIFLIICVISIINIPCEGASSKYSVVETEYGPIRGKLDKTLYDRSEFYAYKGIPFALPPVGNLRFKVCKGSKN